MKKQKTKKIARAKKPAPKKSGVDWHAAGLKAAATRRANLAAAAKGKPVAKKKPVRVAKAAPVAPAPAPSEADTSTP